MSMALDEDDDVHDSELLICTELSNRTYEDVVRIIWKWQVRVGRAAIGSVVVKFCGTNGMELRISV